jgi:2'-5' RNA ligase
LAGRDYRIFVGAFPNGDLASEIQAVRRQYDPVTAQITAPHITVAGTYWRSGSPNPINEAATIARLKALEGDLAPFDLLLGGIRTFTQGERPVVYLGVQVDASLLAARRLLQSVLGPDLHREYAPHLTLAMRLESGQAAAMAAELEQSPWHLRRFRAPIRELRLMLRGPADAAWQRIAVIRLGK